MGKYTNAPEPEGTKGRTSQLKEEGKDVR
jgi:hypothetical protein